MQKQGKNFAAAFIGTALEFYDFALFGLLAPIFSTLFFPKEDPIAALIASYCIFAAGFLIRPLGGIASRAQREAMLEAASIPTTDEAVTKLPEKYLLFSLACSITKIAAPLNSPPAHKPCNKRHKDRIMGAKSPIWL